MLECDRIGNGINHDHVAYNKRIRFCPSCGVMTLARHTRTNDLTGKPIQGSEFWCLTCGFSFCAKMSVDWSLALRMFKEHRQMRPPGRYIEKAMNPSAVEIWKALNPTPPPKQGTYSLGDRLKMALGL